MSIDQIGYYPEHLSEKSTKAIDGFSMPQICYVDQQQMDDEELQNNINVCAMSLFKDSFLPHLENKEKTKVIAEFNQTVLEIFWDKNFYGNQKPVVMMAIKGHYPEAAPDVSEQMTLKKEDFSKNCIAFQYETEGHGWHSHIGETIRAIDRDDVYNQQGRKLRLFNHLLYIAQNLKKAAIEYKNV